MTMTSSKRRRHTPDQIIRKLAEGHKQLAAGKELDEVGLAQFPMVMGGIVPVVNLDGVKPGDLTIDGPTLAKIFLGDIKTWDEQAPPKGTLSHYPNKGDQVPIIPFAPAPPAIADQIYTQAVASKMVVRMVKGEPMAQTLDWASREIEGFSRN